MGFKYREIDAGGGRARILGNSVPKYCSYCGTKLETKARQSGRFDRNTGNPIEIISMDCKRYYSYATENAARQYMGPEHERFYLDDPVHVNKFKADQGWREYLNTDA